MSPSTTDLLARGYFPKELSPMFGADDFGQASKSLTAKFPERKWTEPVEYNLIKPASLRRKLHIPNPFSQLVLSRICDSDWNTLDAHLTQSRISLTLPTFKPDGRCLHFSTPYPMRSAENLRRLGRARHTVVTDISDYYGSIYTHSIEWALHSRATAKANLHNGTTRRNPTLGARLDDSVRNGQEGQTKGIPIGPDTSLLLSEIVLSALDVEIEKRMPGSSLRCIRFMDDLMFAARSLSEAEDFLHAWETVLGRYHLALNPRKTQIIDGPPAPELPWHVALKQFRIRQNSELATTNDIYSFASAAFTLTREYPGEQVLSYAVRRISPVHLKPNSWSAFEDFVYAAAVAEPASIDKVARVLRNAISAGHRIDRDRAAEVLNEICEYHAPFERGFQVSWAMTTLLILGRPMTEEAAQAVSRMQDNCCLLLLFNFIDLNMVGPSSPDMSAAIARAEDADAFNSNDWLLGYECARNSWTAGAAFLSEAHWAELLQRDIAFFKPLKPKSASTAGSGGTGDGPSETDGLEPGDPKSPELPDESMESATSDDTPEGEDTEEEGAVEILGPEEPTSMNWSY